MTRIVPVLLAGGPGTALRVQGLDDLPASASRSSTSSSSGEDDNVRHEDAYGGEMSVHHYFRGFAYCVNGNIPWLLVAALLHSKTTEILNRIGA